MTSWLGIQFPVTEGQYDYIFNIWGHYLCLGDSQDDVLKNLRPFWYINFILPFLKR